MNDLASNLVPMLPEMVLAFSAIALLLIGVLWKQRVTGAFLLLSIIALALPAAILLSFNPVPVMVMNGMFISDPFAVFAKLIVLAGAAISLLLSRQWLTERGGQPFEYCVLILFSTLGMLGMISAYSLLTLYLSLELSSLALYVLAAFDRDNARSSEAGLKYFVLGALASGMLLFGISLIYGFTGAVGFDEIAQALAPFAEQTGDATLGLQAVTLGMVLVLTGLCFKVAAVPFHMWTPDVYEGAPTPVVTFSTIAATIAAFALFTRVLMQPFADLFVLWRQVIVIVAAASMIVGALAALRQKNIKRLLAYSSIGQAGFVLMGLAAGNANGVASVLLYLLIYVFMSGGAFGVVLLMRREGVYVESVSDLAGLSRSRPWLAFVMAACMFSLAGIPPLSGFFAKLYVVLAAVETGLTPLAVLGLVTSVISCYYYLRVVKFMYFDEPAAGFDAPAPFALRLGLGVCAAATLLFFLAPGALMIPAKAAADILLR